MILRADIRGSIEAIRKELTSSSIPRCKIKMLQATVGGVTEADVHLADASDAIIIGFNVVPDEGARTLAEQTGVQIRRYDIIYKLTDDLRAALEGMLKPEQREVELGRALVQRTFTISRMGTIAGCRVLAGTFSATRRVRVIRDNRIIGDYPLESLKREKDDVREVREGFECGIKLAGFNDVKEGDVLEAYSIEEVARTFYPRRFSCPFPAVDACRACQPEPGRISRDCLRKAYEFPPNAKSRASDPRSREHGDSRPI